MKKLSYFLFAFSLLILVVAVAFLYFGQLDEMLIPVSVNVSDKAGFDLNASALSFGSIPRPAQASRNVVFENSYNLPVFLSISSEGEIENLLHHDRFVRVEAGEEKRIGFIVVSEQDTESGYYSGIVRFRVFPLIR
ncbi:hypothetical protein CO038_03440 [Candidatus Pacearchaeota archaeon CG_4_9_14_0_2_um_filter_39_13]|nr:hypothetical protein [Candidatus Pacearchaeota archaeon]OIO44046.1 MAG: hypothetical protein AUJ64_00840 [Candidatus Pacearchaeota archaeon CG1_02_39_14]PJC44514.1 MAG: hypothetical protein CO038_03440 [Candidatus Pacearchaeota archaeon CG_4_9_14_0_2_um_filter_39_13]QBM01510.1 hypothetical protein [uncultured archaeon]